MQNTQAKNSIGSAVNKTGAAFSVCGLGLAALALSGCGMISSTDPAAKTTVGQSVPVTVTGKVHGGQQPITNATVQLYTVGTGGPQSGATALLTSTVTTSDGTGVGGNAGNVNNTLPAGYFSISGAYSCSSATQVYLVATGGNSSAAADGAATNSATVLMAPLGSCTNLLNNANSTFISINELTTVGAAYTLAPYASGYTNIGATGSSPVGLTNAIANFNNLINIASGTLGGPTLPTTATLPTTELNTLANILAACINTSSNTSGNCATLLGATGATDTFGAALAIAKNPGSSTLTALYSLPAAAPPFQPALSAAPNDWTVAIKYSASSTLNTPYGLAIDGNGNVWIANASATSQPIVKLSSQGILLGTYSGTATGLIGPKGIAIDRTGNAWVASPSQNTVVELASNGTLTGTYTAGNLNGPVSIALDSGGNAWVANLDGNSVTELSSGGSATLSGVNPSSSISGPTGIALDSSGNVYVANSGTGGVVKLTHTGGLTSSLSDAALQGTTSVAIDGSGDVWATGSTTGSAVTGSVSLFTSGGAAASYSPLSAGGLNLSTGSAASGTNLWVANGQTAGSLSQLTAGYTSPISPAAGFGSLNAPVGVAVDLSGDVWTADSGDNTVSQFLGLTSPVVTPIAANVGP